MVGFSQRQYWITPSPKRRSMMSVSKLVDLVKPPSAIIERGTHTPWQEIQAVLRLQLSGDYYEYGLTYGSGAMCNGFLLIFNWAAPHYRDHIMVETDVIRAAGTS